MSLHGEEEEEDEVDDEDGPEDRDIEEVKESASHGDGDCLHGTVPVVVWLGVVSGVVDDVVGCGLV